MRILIVEDEQVLADALARGLRREGMAVDVAYDGDSGHEKAAVTRYDVVVLDRDLPGMSGDELCGQITASDAITRVIMLTASGTLADKVEGLALGADDYLAKALENLAAAHSELAAERDNTCASRAYHACFLLGRGCQAQSHLPGRFRSSTHRRPSARRQLEVAPTFPSACHPELCPASRRSADLRDTSGRRPPRAEARRRRPDIP